MECKYAIYCDTARASEIKIHVITCSEHKKAEGHDYEWFYAPTYQNAKIIADLLSKDRKLGNSNCLRCKPQ
jgi:hypothetical protein